MTVDGAFLMSGVVGLEAAVEGNPAQEVVVRGFRHAGGGHIDVGLGDVGIVKFQAVEWETIRPVGGRLGDHAQGREAGLGEDGGVVHEAAEVVRKRDGPVGLVASDIVHQRFECRGDGVLEDEVEFGVQLLQHGEVENATGRGVDAAPGLPCGDHFRWMNQRGIIG